MAGAVVELGEVMATSGAEPSGAVGRLGADCSEVKVGTLGK